MKIEINTKFSIGDIVYGFYNGNIFKFEVKNIKIDYNHNKRSNCYDTDYIKYELDDAPVSISLDRSDEYREVFHIELYERELHTADELKHMVNSVIG